MFDYQDKQIRKPLLSRSTYKHIVREKQMVIFYSPGRPNPAHKPDEWISPTECDKAVGVCREILIR